MNVKLGHKIKLMRQKIRGFTLIELIVAIAIIAILSIVSVTIYSGAQTAASDAKRKSDIIAMAKAYESNYKDQYQSMSGSWFAGGIIPVPVDQNLQGSANYYNDLTSTGFRVCATLSGGTPMCSSNDTPKCFCIDSAMGIYISNTNPPPPIGNNPPPPGSQGISFVGANSTPVGVPTASISINLPGGVQNQDLMIAQIAVLGNLNNTEINLPSGWSQQNLIAETGTGGMTLLLYWKRYSGESGPYAWNFTNTNTGVATNKSVGGGIVVYRNAADPAIPFETSFGIQTSGGSITAQPLITSTVNQMVVYFGMIGANTSITAPAGFTERYNGGLVEAADQLITTSGSVVGPVTGGTSPAASGANIGQLLALRPATSPAPPAPAWPVIPLGAAIYPQYFNEPLYISTLLTKRFDSVSPADGFFMQNFVPTTQGQFDFKTADLVVNFARTYHKKLHLTPFFWDNLLPTWFNNSTNFTGNSTTYTQVQLTSIMNDYITRVGNRYKDIANAWVIVNEAVIDSPPAWPNSAGLRQCGLAISSANTPMPWACINPITSGFSQCTPASPCNYIDQAFLKAREVLGPNVKLCYNDYNAEDLNSKSNYIYSMVQNMKARNIPIHCVGLQSHINSTGYPTYANVKANIQRLNALGVEVRITEIDVKAGPPPLNTTQLNQQAGAFGVFAQACKDSSSCTEFTTWGVSDLHTWLAPEVPLLFDTAYVAKPAYDTVKSVLSF
jgi:endo-1,4-beta-xylanase